MQKKRVRIGVVLLVLIFLYGFAYGGEEKISSDKVIALFGKGGNLLSIGTKSEGSFAKLISLKIYDRTQKMKIDDSKVKATIITPLDKGFLVKKKSKAMGLEYTIEYKVKNSLSSKVTLKNLTDKLRCMEIEYHFQLLDKGYQPFFPGRDDFPSWAEGKGKLVHDYIAGWVGTPLTLPAGTLYAKEKDMGISFVAEFNVPIISFVISMERNNGKIDVIVSRTRVRLDPHSSRSVTTHFVPHRGDWRCGLAFIRSKWRKFFYVKEGSEKFEGNWYDFSIPTVTTAWFGNYFPERKKWLPAIDQKWKHINDHPEIYPKWFLKGKPRKDADWREILKWLEDQAKKIPDPGAFGKELRKKGAPWSVSLWRFYTREEMREKFKENRKAGIPTMLYWNPSEGWVNWVYGLFKGYEVPGWYSSYGTALYNIQPGSVVEKVLWKKTKYIIDNYPNLTGLHVDQAYYGWEDRRHDDGFSIDEKGSFSDLHRNIGRFVRKVTEYAHQHGMYTDQNHPQASIELSGWSDLALVEDRDAIGMGQEYGRYITIGNRNCINLQMHESQWQINLRNGWFTNRRLSPKQDINKLPGRAYYNWYIYLYSPLFELYKGREWVLEPNCLELPDGYDGNLFKRPDGNYVATIISYGEKITSPYWRINVPVKVRIKDAEKVKAVYLISGDILGPRKINFHREGENLFIFLRRHRSVSEILLATNGHFVSINSGFSVKPDTKETISLALDNFTDKEWNWNGIIQYPETFILEPANWIPVLKGVKKEGVVISKQKVNIPPYSTKEIKFSVDVPSKTPSGFLRLQLLSNYRSILPVPDPKPIPQNLSSLEFALEGKLSAWVVPPRKLIERSLSNSLQGGYLPFYQVFPIYIEEKEQSIFGLGVANNTDTNMKVSFTFETKGVKIKDAPTSIVLSPHSVKHLELKVIGQEPGEGRIKVRVISNKNSAEATYAFQVIGLFLSKKDLSEVVSVNLISDLWGKTKPGKPVYLNGEKVGVLERGGGYDVWINRIITKLSKDAVKALGEKNVLKIKNPDDDKFKIRNVFLEVKTKDNRIFFLKAKNSHIYSTPFNWSYSEGERFPFGEKMVWHLPEILK